MITSKTQNSLVRASTETNQMASFESIFDTCDFGLIVLNSESRVIQWNQWLQTHTGIDEADAVSQQFDNLFPNNTKGNLARAINNALQRHQGSVISHSLNRHPLPLFKSDQSPIHQHTIVKSLCDNGQDVFCVIQLFDISAAVIRDKQLQSQAKSLQNLTDKLVLEKEQAQVTLQSIADAVITTDASGRIVIMNKVAEQLCGWDYQSAKGQSISEIFRVINDKTREAAPNPAAFCLSNRKEHLNDTDLVLIDRHNIERAITQSAAPIIGNNNELLGSVLVFRDVSESRRIAAKMNWQAKHDGLTGLLNRTELESEMEQLLESPRKADQTLVFLYLDLDQFKVVNDTCGHSAGDELLRQLSSTLIACLRDDDLVASFY